MHAHVAGEGSALSPVQATQGLSLNRSLKDKDRALTVCAIHTLRLVSEATTLFQLNKQRSSLRYGNIQHSTADLSVCEAA